MIAAMVVVLINIEKMNYLRATRSQSSVSMVSGGKK